MTDGAAGVAAAAARHPGRGAGPVVCSFGAALPKSPDRGDGRATHPERALAPDFDGDRIGVAHLAINPDKPRHISPLTDAWAVGWAFR